MNASPLDPALADLRRASRSDPQGSARQAAIQFEQIFVQMLMKSMREASPQFDPLSSEAGRMFRAALDEQWARAIAARGIGLAPIIERQITRGAPVRAAASAGAGEPQQFISRMAQPAADASRASGIPAEHLIAQAALESGWGRSEPRRADGSPSHNVFGIKAGPGWRGASVEAATTEYVDGEPRRKVERFRAYASYAEAFADHARLLASSPRYREALAQSGDAEGYAHAMQRSGYATDPQYGEKLSGAIRRVRSERA